MGLLRTRTVGLLTDENSVWLRYKGYCELHSRALISFAPVPVLVHAADDAVEDAPVRRQPAGPPPPGEQLQAWRAERARQDAELAASAEADRRRDQERRDAARQRELEQEAAELRQRASEAARLAAQQALPPEPAVDADSAISVRLELPGGRLVNRRFQPHAPVAFLRTLVRATEGAPADFTIRTQAGPGAEHVVVPPSPLVQDGRRRQRPETLREHFGEVRRLRLRVVAVEVGP